MSNLRILSIIGTRPEAVKMAPVVQALRAAQPTWRRRYVSPPSTARCSIRCCACLPSPPISTSNLMRPTNPWRTLPRPSSPISIPSWRNTAGLDPGAGRYHHRDGCQPCWPITTASASGTWRPGCARTTNGSPSPRRSTAAWRAWLADLHFAPTEWARPKPAAREHPCGQHPCHRQPGHRCPAAPSLPAAHARGDCPAGAHRPACPGQPEAGLTPAWC